MILLDGLLDLGVFGLLVIGQVQGTKLNAKTAAVANGTWQDNRSLLAKLSLVSRIRLVVKLHGFWLNLVQAGRGSSLNSLFNRSRLFDNRFRGGSRLLNGFFN